MNSAKVLEAVKRIFHFSINRNGFDRILDKVQIISAGNGNCMAEMVVEKQHTNGYRTLHGGFIASAVDVISSMAVLTHQKVVDNIDSLPNSGVSVDIHVTYLSPANIGDRIIINAETVKRGRNLAFLKVSLLKKDGSVILAQATHTKYVG